jgi:F-type H+-transporting ATPase subunit delta
MALARSTARRYAEAAFEIAQRDDSMEAWLAALAIADERLTSPEVTRLLSNPALPTATRIEVLDRIIADDVSRAPRNLLSLMVRRGRFDLLPGVIGEFRRLYRLREGIVQATVTSASALEASEVAALQERLVAITSMRVELQQEVDPKLLGGIQVRVGDRHIDGYVPGRQERLRADFTTNPL